MNKKAISTILMSLLTISGCKMSQTSMPEPEQIMPDAFTTSPEASAVQIADNKWWKQYGSTELDSLVEQALSESLTIEQAWARLRQARAAELKTAAGDKVQLDMTTGAGTTRTRSETAAGTVENSTDSYSLGLAASYELDLWGKINSQKQAAMLSVNASRESVDTAATTVVAEVVQTWLDIMAARQQRSILKKQLKNNQSYLELIELRFKMSMVTSLDILRQSQTVEQVKASLLLVDSAEQVAMNKLAILLGKMPGTKLAITGDKLPQLPGMPDTGVPSQLLERRPDIRLAMLNVKIAQWNLSQAKADKLPAFKITASYRYADDELKSLFDNWIMNLAANITVPLLNGGRLEAEVDRVKALIDERTAAYKQAVIAAVGEVTNAMIQEQYQRQNIETVSRQLEFARQSLVRAEDQYFNGATDYLVTLSELIKVQALELDILSRQKNLLLYRTALYRSLGGSWLTEKEITESEKI